MSILSIVNIIRFTVSWVVFQFSEFVDRESACFMVGKSMDALYAESGCSCDMNLSSVHNQQKFTLFRK